MKLSHKITALLAACALLLSMTGCGSNPQYYRYDYDLSEYITLAEYKNLSVAVEDYTVTDADIEQEVMATVMYFAQETEVDRAAKKGDTVKFSCRVTLDGEEVASLCEEEGSIVLGFDSYGAEADAALTGVMAGDTAEAERTLESYYSDTELAGKTVQYEFSVTGVYETEQPEYNDIFVKAYLGFDTVAEYEQSLKEAMLEAAELNQLTSKVVQTWTVVVENTEVLKYPEKELNQIAEQLIAEVETYTEAVGINFGEYTKIRYGMTEEEFREGAAELAREQVKQDMIVYAIARAEDLTVTDAQYEEYAQNYMTQMGFTTIEELESRYTREAITEGILGDLAKECVANYAVEEAE